MLRRNKQRNEAEPEAFRENLLKEDNGDVERCLMVMLKGQETELGN